MGRKKRGNEVMNYSSKTNEELLKEIEILRRTIETQKNTINALLNQYVLKPVNKPGTGKK